MPKQKLQHVALLTTGGTIDMDHFPQHDDRLVIGEPFAKRFLAEHIRANDSLHHIRLTHRELFRLNSRTMTSVERTAIARECRMTRAGHIIISIGTDGMLPAAEVLHKAGVGLGNTVVLTGAMRPASMKNSDAEDNLRLALSAVFKRPPGIYVAMGRVFAWDKCEKDYKTYKFVPKR